MIEPVGHSVPPAAATASAEKSRALATASDFDTFLRMLTTQARYQDPLEPIDSTEYAAQLAQFSMVEQQIQTNESLTRLLDSLGMTGLSAVGNWIGMQAQSPISAQYSGAPISVSAVLSSGADRGALLIMDAEGREVRKLDMPASGGSVTWDGLTSDGQPAPFGAYSFVTESWQGARMLERAPAQGFAPVVEARMNPAGVELVLADGRTIPAESVTALRRGE